MTETAKHMTSASRLLPLIWKNLFQIQGTRWNCELGPANSVILRTLPDVLTARVKTQAALRLFLARRWRQNSLWSKLPNFHSHLSHSGIELGHNKPSPQWRMAAYLIGARPIRQTWWSQRTGWEGRWDHGDVLCMGRNHAPVGQLRPQSGRDRLTQPDPSHTCSLCSTSPHRSSESAGSLHSTVTLGTAPALLANICGSRWVVLKY